MERYVGFKRVVVVYFLVIAFSYPASSATPQKRPPTLDDFLRYQTVFGASFSPDGEWVAYQVSSVANSDEAGDIWIVPISGGAPRNLTSIATDGPTTIEKMWWSPISKQIAVLSRRGNRNRLWVWDVSTSHVQLVSDREVGDYSLVEWLSTGELLFSTAAEGCNAAAGLPPIHAAGRAKESGNSGPRVRVFESGSGREFSESYSADLIIADVQAGKERVIGKVPGCVGGPGATAGAVLSPNQGSFTFFEQAGEEFDSNEPLASKENLINEHLYRIGVAELKNPQIKTVFTELPRMYGPYLTWSPDSTEFVLTGSVHASGSTSRTEVLYRCKPVRMLCNRIDLGTDFSDSAAFPSSVAVDSLTAMWSGDHQLLVRGRIATKNHANGSKVFVAYWRADELGHVTRLGPKDGAQSWDFVLADGSGFVGLVDGEIWRANSQGMPTANLTAKLKEKVAEIVWSPDRSVLKTTGSIVVRTSGESSQFFDLELKTGHVTQLPTPPIAAPDLIAYHVQTKVAIFGDGQVRDSFWAGTAGDERSRGIFEQRRIADEIMSFHTTRIGYRTLDGENVGALVIFPPTYKEGIRYPMVVHVYPGTVIEPGNPADRPDARFGDVNLQVDRQILAAHGYIVLVPSMPHFVDSMDESRAERTGKTQDPYLKFTKGVLPAIDRAVELGFADPDRIGVLGESWGGTATYGLITQTARFKGAVAMAATCDFLSVYGTFEPFERKYSLDFMADTYLMRFGEDLLNFDQPPWKDLNRYIRNSPIAYADRVQTPVMIIQGDDDFVPTQQGEEFFAALRRQNKRAMLVRYADEGHGIKSPDNFRDVWSRIYAWFDEFLKAPEASQK